MNKQELITNKQELISKYELIKNSFNFDTVATDGIISDLKRLDEPEKVKVPQCVHKYIQEAEKYNWDLQDLMKSIDDEDSEDLQRWFYHECNQETLARAWLDGYEVEKEKRYLVKLKGIFKGCEYLNFKFGRVWTFSNEEENEEYRTCHTKKELEEANFGWVFDCPGVEVEEVE